MKLRAQERQARDVSWDANVVDNEHLNKKRQKYAVYFIHQIGTVMKKIVQVPVTRLVILQIMKRMIKQEDTPKSNNNKSQSLMRTKFSPITKPIKGARKMKYLVSLHILTLSS